MPHRFDDMASAVQHDAHFTAFCAVNSNPIDAGWNWPKLEGLFASMQVGLWNYPSYGGGTFGNFADVRSHSILVAVCEAPKLPNGMPLLDTFEVTFGNTHGDQFGEVLMSRRRWEIAKRKFSLPNGSYVDGPYLAVLAVDHNSGLVSRGRLWPLWLSPDGINYAFVRSPLERAAMAFAHESRMVFFSPTHLGHLAALQENFGACWRGNIANCVYVPDFLALPPKAQFPIGIGEIYGMPKFKRYVPGMRKKLEYYPRAEVEEGFVSMPIRPLGKNPEEVREMVKAEIAANLMRFYPGVLMNSAKLIASSEDRPALETQICA